MKEKDILKVYVIICSMIVIASIITYININIKPFDKPMGIKTESHWYRCDAILCQQEKENNCSSVKMSCEVCCEK